ncbi:uncharacterized protein B0T23DRAFT_189084 [Neurospora hispaniola]|uniref:Uncharacterized protein n=1 Tax=Neurospora hispaniola TaxID=588809 RepID=A0AAJ0I3V6_9PEZI|nr:hypothetical protein B0T23DRAFT_189084 [Neurospora hispaniola]
MCRFCGIGTACLLAPSSKAGSFHCPWLKVRKKRPNGWLYIMVYQPSLAVIAQRTKQMSYLSTKGCTIIAIGMEHVRILHHCCNRLAFVMLLRPWGSLVDDTASDGGCLQDYLRMVTTSSSTAAA